MKLTRYKYSEKKYERLFMAVAQTENEDYKRFFNLLVEVKLSKKSIFKKFTRYLDIYRTEADMILNKL
jgi:hypothetical protein